MSANSTASQATKIVISIWTPSRIVGARKRRKRRSRKNPREESVELEIGNRKERKQTHHVLRMVEHRVFLKRKDPNKNAVRPVVLKTNRRTMLIMNAGLP